MEKSEEDKNYTIEQLSGEQPIGQYNDGTPRYYGQASAEEQVKTTVNPDYSETEQFVVESETNSKQIIITPENRVELFDRVAENPSLIIDIVDPDLGLSYAAYRGDPSVLEKLNPKHRAVFTSAFFKNNDLSLQNADKFLTGGKWSEITTFRTSDKDIEGKIILTKDLVGNYKISAIAKMQKFNIDDDPIGSQIKNVNLKEKLVSNGTLALQLSNDQKIHFYKLDNDLNRIVEIPRSEISIPAYIKDYELTAFDMNNLLAGKQVKDIPFNDTKISIKYDKENNKIEPVFAKGHVKDSSKSEATKSNEKMLLGLLNKGDTKGFLLSINDNKLKLSDDFIKTNILANKNIPLKDRFALVSRTGKSSQDLEKLYTSEKKPKKGQKQKTGTKESIKAALKEVSNVVKSLSKSQ
ncbi:MAG: DUF3945 domain-containing protein [Saprospiraceae bacterium]